MIHHWYFSIFYLTHSIQWQSIQQEAHQAGDPGYDVRCDNIFQLLLAGFQLQTLMLIYILILKIFCDLLFDASINQLKNARSHNLINHLGSVKSKVSIVWSCVKLFQKLQNCKASINWLGKRGSVPRQDRKPWPPRWSGREHPDRGSRQGRQPRLPRGTVQGGRRAGRGGRDLLSEQRPLTLEGSRAPRSTFSRRRFLYRKETEMEDPLSSDEDSNHDAKACSNTTQTMGNTRSLSRVTFLIFLFNILANSPHWLPSLQMLPSPQGSRWTCLMSAIWFHFGTYLLWSRDWDFHNDHSYYLWC